jgi:hypothetical protein
MLGMSPAKAEPRTYLPVRVHTPVGWIGGRLAMPEGQRVTEHLDHSGSHLRLVEVALPGRATLADFFALRRDAAILVVPETEIELERRDGATAHSVICLYDEGTLHGTLHLPPGVRLSDYLMTTTGYVAVTDCRLRGRGGDYTREQRMPVVFVNPSRVIGFSERSYDYPQVEGLESTSS